MFTKQVCKQLCDNDKLLNIGWFNKESNAHLSLKKEVKYKVKNKDK